MCCIVCCIQVLRSLAGLADHSGFATQLQGPYLNPEAGAKLISTVCKFLDPTAAGESGAPTAEARDALAVLQPEAEDSAAPAWLEEAVTVAVPPPTAPELADAALILCKLAPELPNVAELCLMESRGYLLDAILCLARSDDPAQISHRIAAQTALLVIARLRLGVQDGGAVFATRLLDWLGCDDEFDDALIQLVAQVDIVEPQTTAELLRARQCHGVIGCIRRGALRGNDAICMPLLRFLHGRLGGPTDRAEAESATMADAGVASALAELVSLKPETEYSALAIQVIAKVVQGSAAAAAQFLESADGAGGLTSYIAACWDLATTSEHSFDIGSTRRHACKACYQALAALLAPVGETAEGSDGDSGPSHAMIAFGKQFLGNVGGFKTALEALNAEVDHHRDRPKKAMTLGISGPPCCGGLMPAASDVGVLLEVVASTVALFSIARNQAAGFAQVRFACTCLSLPVISKNWAAYLWSSDTKRIGNGACTSLNRPGAGRGSRRFIRRIPGGGPAQGTCVGRRPLVWFHRLCIAPRLGPGSPAWPR
jgi:hypothetical protein